MKERFFSQGFKEVGTEAVCIYTAPTDMNTAFVTGLFISNTSDRNTFVEVWIQKANQNNMKVQLTSAETPLPAGSTAVITSIGQRVQIKPDDSVWVKCRYDKTADVMISVSEVVFDKFDMEDLNLGPDDINGNG